MSFSPPYPQRKRGFALVVTLTLMVLLSILALGLLSLSSISLRSLGAGEANRTARANARMAMMLAIGDLQTQLGPDQRISAPTSLRDSAKDGRRHWTGVFDSWNSAANDDPTPRPSPETNFRKWLVSGENSTDYSLPLSAPSSGDITLFGDPTGPVRVPKVKLSNGAYAWWVGEENTKALVIGAEEREDTLEFAYRESQSPPVTGFSEDPAFSISDRDDPALTKLATRRSADFITTFPQKNRELFHDFTTISRGVIADVAEGGLKRDLSLNLDYPAADLPMPPEYDFKANGHPLQALYTNGVTWEELFLFHNFWQELQPPVPGLASRTGGDLSGSRMLITAPGGPSYGDFLHNYRHDPYSVYKTPYLLRMQTIVSVWAKEIDDPAGSGAKMYKLHWVVDPIATFWNPFDVPLALHPQSYMSVEMGSIPYTYKIFDNNTKLAEQVFGEMLGFGKGDVNTLILIAGSSENTFYPKSGTADPLVLMPGEALMVSEGPGAGDPIPHSNNQASNHIASKVGWSVGKGRSRPMKDSAGNDVIVSAGADLKVSFEPNSFGNLGAAQYLILQFTNYGAEPQSGDEITRLTRGTPLLGRWVGGQGKPATLYPQMFRGGNVELPTPGTLAQTKFPFMLFAHQTKTEESSLSWTRLHNPTQSNDWLKEPSPRNEALWGSEVKSIELPGGPLSSELPQFAATGSALFGGSYTDALKGQPYVITHSVPREPPLSLGAFHQSPANGVTQRQRTANSFDATTGNGRSLDTVSFAFEGHPYSTHFISNSYAYPMFAKDKIRGTDGQDHSFQTNRKLWDSWFLSGIVQQQAPHHPVKRTAAEVFKDFAESGGEKRLPARAMLPAFRDATAASGDLFGTGSTALPDAYEKAASLLLLDGAFNVNSTSVKAWKALLNSSRKSLLPLAESPQEPAPAKAEEARGVPALGLLTPHGKSFKDSALSTAADPGQWTGYRDLEDSEIDDLAEEIVKKIRARGPFLSLADFINRRLSTDTDLALRGALQAALDKTVNKKLFSANGRTGTIPAGVTFDFPEAARLPKTLGGPAHVSQADILTAIGPRLTARSDTFRIRAYGEAYDKSGNVTARAWCEATVQRTPAYLDPTDAPTAVPTTSTRSTPKITSPEQPDLRP